MIDVQVNNFGDVIAFVLAFDMNSFPLLSRNGTGEIKMDKKQDLLINN